MPRAPHPTKSAATTADVGAPTVNVGRERQQQKHVRADMYKHAPGKQQWKKIRLKKACSPESLVKWAEYLYETNGFLRSHMEVKLGMDRATSVLHIASALQHQEKRAAVKQAVLRVMSKRAQGWKKTPPPVQQPATVQTPRPPNPVTPPPQAGAPNPRITDYNMQQIAKQKADTAALQGGGIESVAMDTMGQGADMSVGPGSATATPPMGGMTSMASSGPKETTRREVIGKPDYAMKKMNAMDKEALCRFVGAGMRKAAWMAPGMFAAGRTAAKAGKGAAKKTKKTPPKPAPKQDLGAAMFDAPAAPRSTPASAPPPEFLRELRMMERMQRRPQGTPAAPLAPPGRPPVLREPQAPGTRPPFSALSEAGEPFTKSTAKPTGGRGGIQFGDRPAQNPPGAMTQAGYVPVGGFTPGQLHDMALIHTRGRPPMPTRQPGQLTAQPPKTSAPAAPPPPPPPTPGWQQTGRQAYGDLLSGLFGVGAPPASAAGRWGRRARYAGIGGAGGYGTVRALQSEPGPTWDQPLQPMEPMPPGGGGFGTWEDVLKDRQKILPPPLKPGESRPTDRYDRFGPREGHVLAPLDTGVKLSFDKRAFDPIEFAKNNPTLTGAGLGTLAGGAVGLLEDPEEDESRAGNALRKALIMGALGSGLGYGASRLPDIAEWRARNLPITQAEKDRAMGEALRGKGADLLERGKNFAGGLFGG